MLLSVFKYEYLKIKNTLWGFFSSLVFFFLSSIVFVFTIGTGELLLKVSTGILWCVLLFSVTIFSSNVFKEDVDDGTIESLLKSEISLMYIIFSKLLFYWFFYGIIFATVSFFVSFIFGNSVSFSFLLSSVMFINLLSMFNICFLASSISLGSQNSSILSSLIVFPLSIPSLIFGSGTVSLYKLGLDYSNSLIFSISISLIMIAIIPWFVAKCLLISVES